MTDSWAVWQQGICSLQWDLQWRVKGKLIPVLRQNESWKHVELPSNRNSHWVMNNSVTHTHASGWAHHVWCESRRKFDILGLGNSTDQNSLFAPVPLSGEKDATKGRIFQDIFKEGTVGGGWHCHAASPPPSKIWRNRPCCEWRNSVSTSNSFLGQRLEKSKQSLRVILDAKNTN